MRKQTSIVSMVILYYKLSFFLSFSFFDVMRQMRISGSNPVSSSTGISDLQPIRVIWLFINGMVAIELYMNGIRGIPVLTTHVYIV